MPASSAPFEHAKRWTRRTLTFLTPTCRTLISATRSIKLVALPRRQDPKYEMVRLPRFIARHVLMIAALIGTLLVTRYLYKFLPGGCTYVITDGVPSPTGSWTALVEATTCNNVPSISITADAELMPTGHASRAVFLLVLDTSGYPDERPRIAWSAPNTLLITLPARSNLRVLTRQVGDVRIDLKFSPNYATRKAWLRNYGMDPDPLEKP